MQILQRRIITTIVVCLSFTSMYGCGGQSAVAAPISIPATTTSSPAATQTKSPDPKLSTEAATASPVPEMSPTPSACIKAEGEIQLAEIPSSVLPRPLKLRIYIPPCWNPGKVGGYPVLILLHGQGSTDDQWDRLGIGQAVDQLISTGESRPFLVVMPREEYYFQSPAESKFGDALVQELIPTLKKEYGVCPQRLCWAIGGISRGAAWAVRIGLTNWQLFESIGAHSLPPFKNDPYRLPEWLHLIPEDQRPRLWIDIGAFDIWLKAATEFANLLIEYHYPFEWHLLDGMHNEDYWHGNILLYLRWYTQIWKPN